MGTRDARADQARVRRIAPFLVCILFAAGCGEQAKLRGIATRAGASDGRCSYGDASFDGQESYNCLYLFRGRGCRSRGRSRAGSSARLHDRLPAQQRAGPRAGVLVERPRPRDRHPAEDRLRRPRLPDCIRAWNADANARLHRGLAAARPRRLASVGAGPIDRRNTCVFTFRSGARYLVIVGHWRGPVLVWTARAFYPGTWSPGFDRDTCRTLSWRLTGD